MPWIKRKEVDMALYCPDFEMCVCSYVYKHISQNQNMQQGGKCSRHVYLMYGITYRNC